MMKIVVDHQSDASGHQLASSQELNSIIEQQMQHEANSIDAVVKPILNALAAESVRSIREPTECLEEIKADDTFTITNKQLEFVQKSVQELRALYSHALKELEKSQDQIFLKTSEFQELMNRVNKLHNVVSVCNASQLVKMIDQCAKEGSKYAAKK